MFILLVLSIRSGPLAVSGCPGPDQGPAHDDLGGVHDQPEQQHHAPQHGEGLAQHLGLALRGPCASYSLCIHAHIIIISVSDCDVPSRINAMRSGARRKSVRHEEEMQHRSTIAWNTCRGPAETPMDMFVTMLI